ncbi:hypothetical protein C8R44DRAFT_875318 [Mycena epipterygia]|nr:hypothetical protein C8R44DRAFT_875318 [Mycena epipterygia]
MEDDAGNHENVNLNEFYGSNGGREDEAEFDFEQGNEYHSEPEDPPPLEKNKENISPKKDADPSKENETETEANVQERELCYRIYGPTLFVSQNKTVEEGSLRKAAADIALEEPQTGKDKEECSLKKARVQMDTRPESAEDESESSRPHKKFQ